MSLYVTISTPATNEVVVSSEYLKAQGSVSRLGASQIEHTSATNALVDDIFFKFYTCDDSTGTKVYSALDVSTAIADSTIQNQFLTMLFTQYYNDPTFVADIGGNMETIAERLQGAVTPTTPLASSLTMPSSSSNFLEFVGMGLGSWVGANYINGGTPERTTSVWGNRVGQVHLTGVDPTVSPVNAIYDNSDAGCWSFDHFNTQGIIVYTNLLAGGAFSAPGLSCWSQLLCVWPILAETMNAQFACMFTNLDQAFMNSGLSFFDRASRADTYYGWAGNYLLSIFNDWGIPVVNPIWSMSDIALAAYSSYGTIGGNATNNYGSLQNTEKAWRFVGPTASNNVDAVNEKVARSCLPLLWANECTHGTSAPSSAIPFFETEVVTNLGYLDVGQFIDTCLTDSAEGYNAHIYKYILDNQLSPNYPMNTTMYIYNGVSWSNKLGLQPFLSNVFTDDTLNYPKYYGPAVSSFYGESLGTYGQALINRIEDGTLIVVSRNNATEENFIESWVYDPNV